MLENILNWLFDQYDKKSLDFCILRNYEKLPIENIGNDIDILIRKSDVDLNETIMEQMCKKFNLTCFRVAKRQYVHQWYFCDRQNKNFKVLQLDFQFDAEWRGYNYINGNTILEQKRRYNNFYVPKEEHEIIILLFASLVWGGFIKEKYSNKIITSIKNKEDSYKIILEKCLGKNMSNRLIKSIINGDIKELEKDTINIRRQIKFNSLKNDGIINTYRKVIEFYYSELKIRLNYPGIFIAILGTDGVGKSTIIEEININLARYFKSEFTTYSHFRPRILKDPGEYLNKKSNQEKFNGYESEKPHQKPPQNIAISIIRMIYYIIDFTLGYWIKFSKPLRKSGMVILDRYYYDFFVDAKRYRLSLPTWIYKLIYNIIPKPDITIYLDAKPEVIYSRKQELSIEELDRQVKEYRKVSNKYKNIKTINTENGIEKAVNEIENIVLEYLILRRH